MTLLFLEKSLNLLFEIQVQKKQIKSKTKTYLSLKSDDFDFDLWAKAVAKQMEVALKCRTKLSSRRVSSNRAENPVKNRTN